MAKIFGGSASRLEVYALFAAAVVLIGGGVAGAVVVTSSDSKPAEIAQVSVDTTVVDTTVVPGATTPPTTAPPRQTSPTTTIYQDPVPVTVTPSQPIQDFSAYCTMPNLLRYFAPQPTFSGIPIQPVALAIVEAGCSENMNAFGFSFTRDECIEPQMPSNYVARVIQQNPAAGTLLHKTFGRVHLRVAISPVGYDLSTPDQHPPYC